MIKHQLQFAAGRSQLVCGDCGDACFMFDNTTVNKMIELQTWHQAMMGRTVHIPTATQEEKQHVLQELRIIERDAKRIHESLVRTNFVWLRPVTSMRIKHAYQALQRIMGYQ